MAAAAMVAFVTEAAAEPAFCDQIRADYVAASRASGGGGGGGGDTGEIRRQLNQALAQSRRYNCQRFFLFGPKPGGQCPSIMARVNRLQAELNRASGFGWGFLGRRQASYDRDRLRESLSRNGCYLPMEGAGVTRTLCVRSCDGYYFPVSSSGAGNRVRIDDSVCKAIYGGAEAEVFVQYSGGGVETARSVSGRSYTDLPNAFVYRETFMPACQAELHDGLKAIAAAQEVAVAKLEATQKADPASLLPHPVARIDASEDPETLANLAGNFRVEPIAPPADDETADAVADAGSKAGPIRRIGPSYYYAKPIRIEGLKAKPPSPTIDIGLVGTAHADEKPAPVEPAPDDPSVH